MPPTPPTTGLRDGRLAPCPATPNCVSTEATDERQRVPPLPFAGAPHDALERLVRVVGAMRGARVAERRDGYLRVEFTTRVLRYVDDAEFLVDPEARVVRFRSASRVGRSDFGTNRRRMAEVARRFAAGP